MKKKKKVVFKDGERKKVAIGFTSFEGDFVKVTNDSGSSILINKADIVFIRDGEY
jgi:predicted DNA-binding antitoxin AbrB/MazE fold protein